MTDIKKPLRIAGDVEIEEATIITNNGELGIRSFITELNLYEDIYQQTVYGNILVNDGLGLINLLDLRGDEYIRIKVTTPDTDTGVLRTYKLYSLTDTAVNEERSNQIFVLHFISVESYFDENIRLFKTFSGSIEDVVTSIFNKSFNLKSNIFIDKNISITQNDIVPLEVLTKSKNKIKFVSPGWSPFKCLTWAASKTIPAEFAGSDFMFWGSMRGFYFGSLSQIYNEQVSKGSIYAYYNYYPNQAFSSDRENNLNKEYSRIYSLKVLDTFNSIRSTQIGQFSSTLVSVDMFNKKIEYNEYDHFLEYNKFLKTGDRPFYPETITRNGSQNLIFSPKNLNLFNSFQGNYDQKNKEIIQNRNSLLNDLHTQRIEIEVPGRTDIEVGLVVYLNYPRVGSYSEEDKTKPGEDSRYSGNYLITAIRHKINLNEHRMILELSKDSLGVANYE